MANRRAATTIDSEAQDLRIAILEDDSDQASLYEAWLHAENHKPIVFRTGTEMIRALRADSFDLLMLDWDVPDMSGIEVLEWTRSHYDWNIPIVFVTRMNREQDVVKALEDGADDFIEKPVRRGEMVARLNALSRRADLGRSNDHRVLEFAPYKINLENRTIVLNSGQLDLTQKEYELAVFLFRNAGRALSRGHILDNVWGTLPDLNTRTVDTHISRLRKKMDIAPHNGWVLTSIYQHGYRLDSRETTS